MKGKTIYGLATFIAPAFALAIIGAASNALAQKYPDKPVRLVVGFPPGGAGDILARMAAQPLSVALREQVVVDNRGGAGGLVATEIVAHSVPDGYTVLFTSIPHVINPFLYKKVDYDPIKDFDPVVQFVAAPLLMATNVNVNRILIGSDSEAVLYEAAKRIDSGVFEKHSTRSKRSRRPSFVKGGFGPSLARRSPDCQ